MGVGPLRFADPVVGAPCRWLAFPSSTLDVLRLGSQEHGIYKFQGSTFEKYEF